VRPLTQPSAILSPSEGERGGAALVNCFYRLANPTTLAMQCEAVAINADFWSQVLQSCSLKPMDFALGAVMLTQRTELAGIGGFTAIKDCLADDYQLGNRIAKRGGRIELCPVVVECWDAPMGWAAVWKHQLRWARTVRVCQPVPYFFSILSNPTFWPALWAAITWSLPALVFLGVALVVRLAVTADLQRQLMGEAESGKRRAETGGSPPDVGGYDFWLAPGKDLMQVGVWALAFLGNTIEWRGRRMRLRPDGTLIPA
jgi:ceramide glucosyltransferase